MGSNPVEVAWVFQVSIRDTSLNCPDKSEDHCYLSFHFAVKRTVATINSLEELENQTEIEYGVLDNGSVQTFFKTSEDPPLQQNVFVHAWS